jgi:mRNA interferase RelE/StbE
MYVPQPKLMYVPQPVPQPIIKGVDNADRVHELVNLKKLKADGNYYRIKSGDYRIGLIIKNDTVHFVRLLHRKEIYRYFP